MSGTGHFESKTESGPPWEEQVIPYLLNELTPPERAAFEVCMRESALCRLRVYEARQIIEQLRGLPAEKASPHLIPAVRRIISSSPAYVAAAPRRILAFGRAPILKVAAGLLVLLGASWLVRSGHLPLTRPNTERSIAIGRGLEWLAQAQDSSGVWLPARWDGRPEYAMGLTGLALLALAGGGDELGSPVYAEQLRRGAAALIRAQTSEGWFGGSNRTALYNHPLATLALLEIYARQPTEELRIALDKAIHVLAAGPVLPSSSLSTWPQLVLQRAETLGWKTTDPANEENRVPFKIRLENLARREAGELNDLHAAAGTLDGTRNYTRLFFQASGLALSSRNGDTAMLTTLQANLIQAQRKEGELAGSWDLSDRWSSAGGRVYTTSLATLALCVERSDG